MAKVSRWSELIREHPLLMAAVLVVAGAGAGYVVAGIGHGKLREVMLTAATTLIFVALLGGVVKLLLDDVERARERRREQARFVAAVLADLKSVYDRVERVRILVAAHRSALTYGNEMRDLIGAAVQLRNVERALDQETSGIRHPQLEDVALCVESMEAYLNCLIREFTIFYKPIADKQRIYEAEFEYRLKNEDLSTVATTPIRRAVEVPINEAWTDIQELPRLREFRDDRSGSLGDGGNGGPKVDDEYDYARDFVSALDLATWILRSELGYLAGIPETEMPEPHRNAKEQLLRVGKRHLVRPSAAATGE